MVIQRRNQEIDLSVVIAWDTIIGDVKKKDIN